MTVAADDAAAVARLAEVSLHYGAKVALEQVSLAVPAGCMVGLIGPDGVGKSSLLALISGARAVQRGEVFVLGGDMRNRRHRMRAGPSIAYMPQGLGRNLYPLLSVEDNLQFFGRLFGHDAAERRRRIDELTAATGLSPFLQRPVGKLSGGMKQKLGLCCALIHDPTLLLLDEPTTGVDPLARSQFWALIGRIRQQRPGMSVVVATAYMEEADGFDWLVAMDAGRVLATGTPQDLRERTRSGSLEEAFIAMLPQERRRGHTVPVLPPYGDGETVAIEAQGLTMRFGDFTAVDRVDLRIRRGEIFGFLGSNGCGKTTTMKMLTGLLPPTQGQAKLFGQPLDARDIATRRRVGYMSQVFSLYSELSVEQNLVLHARLFGVPEGRIASRVSELLQRFGLQEHRKAMPDTLPLGMRQRLALTVALVHQPEVLLLDEPTSGVDPVARDTFWQFLIELSRTDGVTIFISTHFMNEAQRCDRISFMHDGRILATDAPTAIIRQHTVHTLEEAFIACLQAFVPANPVAAALPPAAAAGGASRAQRGPQPFSARRAFSYALREAQELRRDPLRLVMAVFGSMILMLIMGYGITMDVNDLTFAVLDRDRSAWSQDYANSLAGSRYFIERPPLADYAELDRRMRSGEISLAVEFPPGFGRDLQRGQPVEIGAWIDGTMPMRAETLLGYVQGMHQGWLQEQARTRLGGDVPAAPATVEVRYRYNPEVTSLPAMVPAVAPILLMMIPAMLTALSVVREKELGSIVNFYVTPVTRAEFLVGKQVPYIVLAMVNLLILTALAVTLFKVPVKGSFATLLLASLLFSGFSTGFGLFSSIFTRSQTAAMFFAMVGSMIPAIQFAGLLHPVSSLEGVGRMIGEVYPLANYVTISRGVFSKALDFADLRALLLPMALAAVLIVALSVGLLNKQER